MEVWKWLLEEIKPFNVTETTKFLICIKVRNVLDFPRAINAIWPIVIVIANWWPMPL